jgi:hypothetical protein
MKSVQTTVAHYLACAVLIATPAVSQESDYGRTQRGRLPDSSVNSEAQIAAGEAGVNGCLVTRALFLGRDATGSPQYEIVCREGSGYIVLGASENRAYDCLSLERQAEARRAGNRNAPRVRRCRLSRNRAYVAAMSVSGQ